MFKPLPMKHVLLQLMTDDLPRASLALAELGVFDPDYRSVDAKKFPTIPGGQYRNLFQQAFSRLEKIKRLVPLRQDIRLHAARVIDEQELTQLNQWLGETWALGSTYEERFRRLADESRLADQLESALATFSNLNIDLSLLRGEKRFLNLFIGLVPRDNARQLEEALGLANHLLYPFMSDAANTSVIIVGPRASDAEAQLQSVLQSADFHALSIPPELHDQPGKIRGDIARRRQRIAKHRAAANAQMQAWAENIRAQLEESQRVLLMAEPFVRLDSAVRSTGQLAAITGWVPAQAVRQIEAKLGAALLNPFLLSVRDPERKERALVPTALAKNRWLAPYKTLIQQYGIPRYGEIDPTPLFALTYVLMFGMMFGDIGHGLVFIAAGWLLRRKLGSFTPFVLLAGLSATVFGFLYGSLFGFEHLLQPLWVAPLSDPLYMLGVALLWGVGFLLGVSLLAIRNRLVIGDYIGAVFDNNGVLSIALYIALLWGVYQWQQSGSLAAPAALTALLCLLALMVFKWRESEAPLGERALVTIIETLETLTGYVSNTLSFLRVAAFSLNHVALAIAVFTLAAMMDTAGHGLTVFLGNVFIMVLEGAIVTIQVLRLEYYEGFSRFFSGDGIEFRPLKLGADLAE